MECYCNNNFKNAIILVRGNDTNFNDATGIKIYINTTVLDLSTFKAVFKLGNIVKTFDDISSGEIELNFTAAETAPLQAECWGTLNLIDTLNRIATIENRIPFKVISIVDGNAIATQPYTLNFDVKQGGETILNISVESAVTVEVGTTTTLPPGSEATVTNAGTPNHLILNFGIPRGYDPVWGHIEGDIMEQQDLQDELNSISGGLADSITALDDKFTSITGALDDKIDSVSGALSDSITAVDNKYDSITGALSDSITGLDNKYDSITGALSDSIQAVDDKYDTITSGLSDSISAVDDKYDSITGALSDSITALDSVVSSNFTTLSDSIVALDSVVSDNYNTLDGKIDSINGALSDSITALDSIVSDNFTTLSDSITNNYNTLDSLIGGVDDKIDTHIADVNNPHSVTKTQVGLGNCDNTSDADKPVSTAQQTALDGKVDKNAAITAATKCKITYDAKGLVTAGADLQQSDIPALNLTKISDVTSTYTEVNQLHESGAVKADFEKLHAITADAAELNILDGVTASTSEINTLDGLTASTAELNILDGATVTTAELNVLDGITASTTELNYCDGVTSAIQTQFDNITDVIPAAASDTNQLADKNFVNSSIATNTANFIGTFNSVADLEAYSGTLTNNDYAFVIVTDSLGNNAYDRYKYTTATTPASWVFEYELNNSSFTSDQWAAINSLITADTKVTHTANTAIGNSTTPVYIDASGNATALSCTLATSVPVGAVFTDTTYAFSTGSANGTIAVSVNGGAATDVSVKGLGSAAYTSSGDYATAAQGTKADSAVQSVTTGSSNGTISVDGTDVSVYGLGSAAYTASSAYATSSQGAKADSAIQSVKVNGSALTPDANKAVDVTVPTVNNSTITIQKNGSTVDTFNLNQATAKTINITVPTDTGDLTNNAGYIKGITSAMVTTALSYTPYDASNPDGFISSAALTNYVTTDTAQDITGTKTYIGQKKIEFKQSAAADKLGFTCFDSSSNEIGAFEYRPNTINGGALLNVNVSYASTSYVGFRYWGTNVNIVAPKVATAGSYYIPVNITNGNTTVTANNAGTVDISSLMPSLSGYQTTSNLVTSFGSTPSDSKYPSEKLVYDTIGNVESILQNINSGT